MVDERDVERYLVRRVEEMGGKAFKMDASHNKGIPDRLLCLSGGRVIWCELKKPKGGIVGQLQKVMHVELRRMGFEVVLVKSKAEADELIKRADEQIKRADEQIKRI